MRLIQALCVLLMTAALTGCGTPRTLRLTSDLQAPVLLGEPIALDRRRLPAEDIEEEYWREVTFGDGFAAPTESASREPAYQVSEEEGRTNVFDRNCVQRVTLKVGRYDGLLLFIPVGQTWLGFEGRVARVSPVQED